MKAFRYWSMIPVLLGIAGALAQDPGARPNLIITPHEASLQPGEGVKFDAAVFGPDGRPQRVESVRWSVEPDTLGRITEDGYFIAGRFPGKGRVLAFAKVPLLDELLQAEAAVVVGRPDPSRVIVVVSPPFAIVPPGQSEQFNVAAFSPANVPVSIKNVRWNVRPESLGRIDETGRFTAGREFGEGVIIAFVETDQGVFNGEARVKVAARPNSAITGRVTFTPNAAAGVAGVVFAESVGPNRWRGEAQIDSDGSYFIDTLVPGLYVVRAQARGFLPEFYQEASEYLQATPVQLALHDTARGIDFTLERGGAIQGTVGGDDRDGLLASAHVAAVLTVRPGIRHHAVTDEQGGFSIENLPTGTYAVFAESEGYKGEYYDDAQSLLQAKLIQVAAPQIVAGIHFSLAPGSAIAGQVLDAITQAAIANAKIVIMPARPSPLPFVKIIETDAGGAYLASVPPGQYVVSAEARGYLPEFYDGVRLPREATIVEVKADERTTGINFALDKLGSISGAVVEQSNTPAPIAGALVLAFPERGRDTRPVITPNAPFVGRTDDTGAYTIAHVPPGKYYVLAEARGYLNEFWKESPDLAGAQLVELGVGSGVSGIDFTLEKGGAIAGTVISANNNQPVGGVQVQIWSRTNNTAARGETDREGKYRIAGLRTGEYLVSVEGRGFKLQFFDGVDSRDQATPVSVEAPNETGGIDFKLQPADASRGAITGIIVSEADGNPIPEAVVLAQPLQSGRPQLAFADRLGAYKFSGLAPGRYVVFAHAPHFLGEFYDDARSFQNAKPVAVEAGQEAGGIDFRLAPRLRGAYVITGTIRRDNDNQGESNAVVYTMENDVFVASAITDGRGNFVMADMPAGTYKVMATAPGGSAFFGGSDATSATTVYLGNGANASNVTFSVPGGVTAVDETGSVSPATFTLEQNYPNPFNPETMIPYQLAGRSEVKLIIYNAIGQEVRRLVSATQDAGVYRVRWDGKDNLGHELTSGVYIYRLITGEVVLTRKMIFMR